MIYLDNAATTYPKSEVFYSAIDDANRNHAFNIGRSSYNSARECFSIMEETRSLLGAIVSADKSNVYFASSATEALNQIIYGLDLNKGDNVYVSPFEHNAIMRPLHLLEEKIGISVKVIPFNDETWAVDEIKCINAFALYPPKAVFLSQVSNVTGYCLPYQSIFELSKTFGSVNILDASQGFAVLPIKKTTSIDFIVFAGHKSLYAGFGIAGFIKTGNVVLNIVKAGGTGADSLNLNMPDNGYSRYEAGSPNIVAVYGLKASLEWHKKVDIEKKERELTRILLSELEGLNNIIVFKPESSARMLGIVSFAIEGYLSDDVGIILSDEFDIAVRTGYHCAPLVHNFIKSIDYGGTIRVSFGAFNSEKDISELIKALKTL